DHDRDRGREAGDGARTVGRCGDAHTSILAGEPVEHPASGEEDIRKRQGPSAHPAEPGYPCYVSVLGELAWMLPRGGPHTVYPSSRVPKTDRTSGAPPRYDRFTRAVPLG